MRQAGLDSGFIRQDDPKLPTCEKVISAVS
jgi:hypothetical protein